MEEFAKVEKLREATGVTFEDSRNALRACDGNMIDAMVYLEKLGKVTTYLPAGMDKRNMPITADEIAAAELKRAYEEAQRNERYAEKRSKRERKEAKREAKREAKFEAREIKREAKFEAREVKREARLEARRVSSSCGLGSFIGKVFRFLVENKLSINKDGRNVLNISLLGVIILSGMFFPPLCIAFIISLCCGFDYSFNGDRKKVEYTRMTEIEDIDYDRDMLERKLIEEQLKREEMRRIGTVAEI